MSLASLAKGEFMFFVRFEFKIEKIFCSSSKKFIGFQSFYSLQVNLVGKNEYFNFSIMLKNVVKNFKI